jgi:hypothetical protein
LTLSPREVSLGVTPLVHGVAFTALFFCNFTNRGAPYGSLEGNRLPKNGNQNVISAGWADNGSFPNALVLRAVLLKDAL